jgi:release factor glutamine methyltransferase
VTISEAVARARQRLVAGGVPAYEAPGDAEVLARHVLGWDLAHYAVGLRDTAPAAFLNTYDALVARRLRREPVSQIVGHREFWGLDFEVTRDVLTPRPETELVVQAALDVWPPTETVFASDDLKPLVVDIGTGSGCIAIALATELPDARFIASDASLAALTLARRNAARHGVADRIAFRHTRQVPPENGIDIVVCNPPYIPLGQRDALAAEVRDFEPEIALFGGKDGLDVYRELFEACPGDLLIGGWLIIEVGYDQANAVRALANPRDWQEGRTYSDLQGIERVLTFRIREKGEASDE